jgi:hypothetical protein
MSESRPISNGHADHTTGGRRHGNGDVVLPRDVTRSFTSRKLDLLKCLNVDPRVKSSTFKIAYCILQHVNEKTGAAFVSDQTIHDETNVCVRQIIRARQELRDLGWMRWRRSRSANTYRFNETNKNGYLDILIARRDARQDQRNNRGRLPKL